MSDRFSDAFEGISRRDVLKATGVTGLVGGMASFGLAGSPRQAEQPDVGVDVRARQESGGLVYWVLPGPRRLSEQVFGTPEYPKAQVRPHIERAEDDATKELLREFPILVGVPLEMRETNEAETRYTTTTFPTPYSDDAEPVTGSFEVTYRDRRPYDIPGAPTETEDSADLSTTFADPDDNEYELRLRTLFQFPISGYETAGGVMTNAWHHGQTGTGTPLLPRVYNYGAFWGIGDVAVNGEVASERMAMHFMTSQTVRTEEYALATAPELPLQPEETIAGQVHHTHGFVLPVTVPQDGPPQYEPVNTAYEVEGVTQPFIHVMFEEDTVVDAPFADWEYPTTATPTGTATRAPTATETPEETATGTAADDRPYDFRLDGLTNGWVGLYPSGIEGQTNPPLSVTAGEEYTVEWVNADGAPHNFAILDDSGSVVVRTEIMSDEGATQRATFTATEAMAEYYCQVHPVQMIGPMGVSAE